MTANRCEMRSSSTPFPVPCSRPRPPAQQHLRCLQTLASASEVHICQVYMICECFFFKRWPGGGEEDHWLLPKNRCVFFLSMMLSARFLQHLPAPGACYHTQQYCEHWYGARNIMYQLYVRILLVSACLLTLTRTCPFGGHPIHSSE